MKPIEINLITALNTISHYQRTAKQGLFFNSPDSDVFDGSAEGYWLRVAKSLGATEDELKAD